MRATLCAVAALLGCERAEVPPPPTKPAVAVKPPPILPPVPTEHVVVRSTRVIEPRTDGLPNPRTDEPGAYQAWFAALPRTTRRKIHAVCRRAPRDFQFVCGGIGHLHIPYPPWIRAVAHRPEDPTIWLSSAQWDAALTVEQKRYIERMCPGGATQPASDLCGANTPLVVAFEGEPVTFATAGSFAFAPGLPVATDWPAATTPWIVLDRDGNGMIDSGAELFGDRTRRADGTRATNGFVALAALDANHDDVIDARDPGFDLLQLWADRDGDQRSTPDELQPLAERVIAVSLAAHLDVRCDPRGNCEGERAAITWRGPDGAPRTGAVVDVYLPRR